MGFAETWASFPKFGFGAVIITALVVGVLAVIAYFLFQKYKYRYTFVRFTKDLKHSKLMKGCVRKSPNNKTIKEFYIKENQQAISKKAPDHHRGNNPEWWMTLDDNGELVYLTPTQRRTVRNKEVLVDKQKLSETIEVDDYSVYPKLVLVPEERTVMATRIKDNQDTYGNKTDAAVKAVVFSLVVVVLVVFIGAGYVFSQMGSMMETISSTVKHMEVVSDNEIVILERLEKLNKLQIGESNNVTIELLPE